MPVLSASFALSTASSTDDFAKIEAKFLELSGSGEIFKRVSISNANYTLQFAFERTLFKTYDKRHKDRLFDYGYIGKFETEQDIFRNRLKTLTIENQRLLSGKHKYDNVIDESSSSRLNNDINVSSPSRFKKTLYQ